MGNLCYKNMREPPKDGKLIQNESETNDKQQHFSTNLTNQSNDNLSKDSGSNYRQYKDNNVVEQMKSKKINTKKLCRPSKVIHEQSSVYNRDTEQISNASNFSGNYETVNLNPNESAAISMFVQGNSLGQQVKIGDTVILRNLKDHFYLFCKYQKLKKYDKQNLVKLEKHKDDNNEMYLTWKFKSIHPENNYLKQQQQQSEDNDSSSPEYESIDMGDMEIENNQCVKIQHVTTSCYLQSNKSYRHDPSSKVNNGQLVSGGPHNRITSHQQWTIELLQPSSSFQQTQQLHINQLFRIKHTETNTYLTSVLHEVCCLKVDDINKQFEEQKNDSIQECGENSNSISKNESEVDDEKRESANTSANPTDLMEADAAAAAVTNTDNQNENDQTPTTHAGDQSKSEELSKKENEDKPRFSQLQVANEIRRSERYSIDSALNKKHANKLYLDSFQDQQGHNTYIDVNCKSNEQIEIANLINDEAMSDNGESLFKLKQQQYLNDQINNEFYKMNNYSQQIAQQEKEMIRKKQEQFLQIISNGDLWYISEVIPHQ